ncbi:hypothetical protein [Sphingobacterium thalpophilum]|uniref:hypothetical protein n=1 Tax=Sphingobacterium thalpophilum TaxID=259 RepID=UPI003C726932
MSPRFLINLLWKKNSTSLQIVNPKAARMGIGSRMYVIAIDQNVDNVRSFGVYAKENQGIITHLRNHDITSMAMEGTGSY